MALGDSSSSSSVPLGNPLDENNGGLPGPGSSGNNDNDAAGSRANNGNGNDANNNNTNTGKFRAKGSPDENAFHDAREQLSPVAKVSGHSGRGDRRSHRENARNTRDRGWDRELAMPLSHTEIREFINEVSSLEVDTASQDSNHRPHCDHDDFDFFSSGEETTSLSAEIDAALANAERAGGGALARVGPSAGFSSLLPKNKKMLDAIEIDVGRGQDALEKTQSHLALEQANVELRKQLESERALHREALQELRMDMDHKLLTHYSASKDSHAIKESLGDFELSAKNYAELKVRRVDALSVREYVLLRVYEIRHSLQNTLHQQDLERERLLAENTALQNNVERLEATVERARRSKVAMQEDYEALRTDSDSRIGKLQDNLRTYEGERGTVDKNNRRFHELLTEKKHLEERVKECTKTMSEMESMLEAHKNEAARRESALSTAMSEKGVLQQQDLGQNRQIQILEAQNERLRSELDTMNKQNEELREKKRNLVRQQEARQAKEQIDLRETMHEEIRKLEAASNQETEHIKRRLMELHEKESAMLKERVDFVERERERQQQRADDEEQRRQELQLEVTELRSRLSHDITELKGVNRLKQFELEKYSTSYEETLKQLSDTEGKNATLSDKVELLKKEYYELESRLKQEQADIRAQNVSLKEQLQGYYDMEIELNSAIRDISENRTGSNLVPESVEDALLLGTTLGSAPSNTRKRIQENLVLAQQLQRKGKDLADAKAEVALLQTKLDDALKERDVAQQAAVWRDEPRHYLVESLKEKESELVDTRRDKLIWEKEYGALQEKHKALQQRCRDMEVDLKAILAHRDQVNLLKNEVLRESKRSIMPPGAIGKVGASRAEAGGSSGEGRRGTK